MKMDDQEMDRLARLLDGRIEECCETDVRERAAELESLGRVVDSGTVEAERDRVQALSSETRYRLARALVKANGELCVCELNAMLDVSDSAVSHGLSRLADAGLVTCRQEGRWRIYRATNVAVTLVTALGIDPVAGDGESHRC